MGGRISSLISEDRRAALHVAFLQVLPNRVYALEEICFKAGSLYDSPEFAEQAKHVPVFSALRLHEWSILQLWRHFRTMNETSSGSVNLWEFREYFDLPDDRSTTRLFRCFDEDRDNRVGFLELVVGLWTYCCNCDASAVCLSFDVYDTDHNGQIGPDEFDFMIQDVFGPEWEQNDIAVGAHTWFHERDEVMLGTPELGIDDWSTFLSTNLQIQAPAIHTRLIFQKKILGVGFWTYCLRKSITVFLGCAVKTEKILSANVSEAALEEIAQDRRLELDHNENTQFTLRVLRRTGPFPRRRKFRDLAGKKLAVKAAATTTGAAVAASTIQKFATLAVREAFKRVTVPPGQDATWEEAKPPSALQALIASLAALAERHAPGGGGSRINTSTTPPSPGDENSRLPLSPPSSATTAGKKKRAPDALSLLKHRPGIDGAALGSPAAAPASPAAGGGGSAADADPVIANAFYGLKLLPPADAEGGGGSRGGSRSASPASRRRIVVAARSSPKGAAAAAAARPSTAGRGGGRAVVGGKSTLSRTGKELLASGEIGRVGVKAGEGDGDGGGGALSARILGPGNGRKVIPDGR